MISGEVRRTLMWRNWIGICYLVAFGASAILDAGLWRRGQSLPALASPVSFGLGAVPVALALILVPYRSGGEWRIVKPRPAAAIGLLAAAVVFYGAALILGMATL